MELLFDFSRTLTYMGLSGTVLQDH